MKLSLRLNKICELVDNVDTIADVGCDHGKVIAQLFLDNKIKYAYLSDISAPSVNKAKELLEELNIDKNHYEIIVSDGFKDYKANNIDLAIIAGMGGLEIKKILEENTVNISSLILGPNNNDVLLRKYLINNGYKIVADFVVKDMKKYYNIIKVVKGKCRPPILYQYFGNTNFERITDDFVDYIEYERHKTVELLSKVPFLKSLKYRRYLRIINKATNKITRKI